MKEIMNAIFHYLVSEVVPVTLFGLAILMSLGIVAWKVAKKKSEQVVAGYEGGLFGKDLALRKAAEFRLVASRHYHTMMCHKAGILAAILIFVFLLADSMTTEGKCVVFIIFALVATSVFLSRFTLAMLNNFSAIRIEEAVRRKEGNGT